MAVSTASICAVKRSIVAAETGHDAASRPLPMRFLLSILSSSMPPSGSSSHRPRIAGMVVPLVPA